jgi:imidazolonepropionase-like amidohydrolase
VVKIYADHHYGPSEPSRSTLSEAELAAGAQVGHGAGRIVALHAATSEGMRRAIEVRVDTIEHRYGGTRAIFKAMHDHDITLCATLATSDAIARYRRVERAGAGTAGCCPEPRLRPNGDGGGRTDLHRW